MINLSDEPDSAFELYSPDPRRPSAALVKDLKQRGLWEDTLIIWGGEFGRRVLHQLGIDHEQFTHRFQGLDFKLTGVEKSRVVTDLLA